MAPSTQPSPAEMHKQAEEMRRIREAREREEQEKEEVLLWAAEEEEEQEAERKQRRAEAACEAEQELREQGWRLDESLEEFWQHQWREEKQREVDVEDWGPCLGCQSRKIDCVHKKKDFYYY